MVSDGVISEISVVSCSNKQVRGVWPKLTQIALYMCMCILLIPQNKTMGNKPELRIAKLSI